MCCIHHVIYCTYSDSCFLMYLQQWFLFAHPNIQWVSWRPCWLAFPSFPLKLKKFNIHCIVEWSFKQLCASVSTRIKTIMIGSCSHYVNICITLAILSFFSFCEATCFLSLLDCKAGSYSQWLAAVSVQIFESGWVKGPELVQCYRSALLNRWNWITFSSHIKEGIILQLVWKFES